MTLPAGATQPTAPTVSTEPVRRSRRPRAVSPRSLINLIFGVTATAIAVAPLVSVFELNVFWRAAGGGIVLGGLVAYSSWLLKFSVGRTSLAVFVAYFLFGAPLVFSASATSGFLPSLEILRDLAFGVVTGWKSILTVEAPVVGFEPLGVTPYLLGLLGSSVAVSFALRLEKYALTLAPIGIVFALAIAFSTFTPVVPVLIGALLAAVMLGWCAWRAATSRMDALNAETLDHGEHPALPGGSKRTVVSLASAAGVLLVSALVTVMAVGPVLQSWPRAVLRDTVVPPLDFHDYPSPLQAFRGIVEDGADRTLFTVTGLPEGTSIRLASLDMYDGIVYRVSGSGGDGSGEFARVGTDVQTDEQGQAVQLDVSVTDLNSEWVPTVGTLDAISFDGPNAAALADSAHYNRSTGSVLVTTPLTTGDSYSIDVIVPPVADDKTLAEAGIAGFTTPQPPSVPAEALEIMEAAIEGASTPIEQLRALEGYLRTEGFFSHGLEGEVASRSGHTQDRVASLFKGQQMIGDEEQYAVAMALMVSQLGMPVRVVMGYSPEIVAGAAVEVTGDDVDVWVEVPFEGEGWVAFRPTPPEDQVPMEEVPEDSQRPQEQVLQPPPDPQPPVELPPQPPVEEVLDEEKPETLEWLWAILRVVGSVLGVVLLILIPGLVLSILKARRRRKRRAAAEPSDRFDGAWHEVVDAAVDSGSQLPLGATRHEDASALAAEAGDGTLVLLAARADNAVFAAGDPSQESVDIYWGEAKLAAKRFRRRTWRSSIRAFYSPASIVRELRRRHETPKNRAPAKPVRRDGDRA